jgi:CheY-like chemotaxis protein
MVATSLQNGSDQQYDCILMDYEMPRMDGPTSAKHIRNMGLDVFILGITGNVLPEDVEYFKSCGANDVLAKPVKLTEIECVWMECGIYDNHRTGHKATTAPLTSKS